jgi:hypothetical protein
MSARLDLLKDTIATASENYKDNVRAFGVLDDKAQKTGAIAGLFLAALFAYIKPDTVGTLLTNIGSGATSNLTGVILLLMICCLFSLLTMWAGTYVAPLNLEHMTEMSSDLLHFSEAELGESVLEVHYGEKIAVWEKCIAEQKGIAARKLVMVFLAQVVLLLAILWTAFMLINLLHAARTGAIPTS